MAVNEKITYMRKRILLVHTLTYTVSLREFRNVGRCYCVHFIVSKRESFTDDYIARLVSSTAEHRVFFKADPLLSI